MCSHFLQHICTFRKFNWLEIAITQMTFLVLKQIFSFRPFLLLLFILPGLLFWFVCVTKPQMQQVIKRAAWKLAFLIRSGLYACHKLTEQKAQLSVVQGYLNVGRVYKYFPYKEAFELSRTWITSPPHCPTLRADCGNLERYICVCVI